MIWKTEIRLHKKPKGIKSAFPVILAAIIFIFHIFVSSLYGEETKKGDKSLNIEELPKELNLHFTGKYCKACHDNKPREGGKAVLKYDGDYNTLCQCHDNSLGNYIHPVGIAPSEGKRSKIPLDFPLRKGNLWCITCHDIELLCLETEKTNSLRGAPFENRTQFCFNCHNEKNYMMHDIHKQINEKGEMIDDKCLSCHIEKPDADYERFGDVKLVENMEAVCQGCHLIGPLHAGRYDHMKKPSLKGLIKMKHAEETDGIMFPLDEKGKMTCITCHNPHAKGVIPEDKPAAKGADSKFRHRTSDICAKCHQF